MYRCASRRSSAYTIGVSSSRASWSPSLQARRSWLITSTDMDEGSVGPSLTAGLYCRARIDRSTIRHDADHTPIDSGFLGRRGFAALAAAALRGSQETRLELWRPCS